jgi:hypothetical protein
MRSLYALDRVCYLQPTFLKATWLQESIPPFRLRRKGGRSLPAFLVPGRMILIPSVLHGGGWWGGGGKESQVCCTKVNPALTTHGVLITCETRIIARIAAIPRDRNFTIHNSIVTQILLAALFQLNASAHRNLLREL